MKRFNLAAVFLVSIMFSCDDDTYSFRYFPDKPENMAEFNSEYDDYNSYLVVIGDSGPFCFSSNRNSLGKNSNIIYKPLSVYMEKSPRMVNLKDFYYTPEKIKFCNSSYDDAYPAIMPDTSSIYFCSDREGSFDIYTVDLPGTGRFIDKLYDLSEREVKKVSDLSSEYDDKCPFIAGNLLVFTSDRPGGYGGFDLYYSIYDGSRWISPVNFGEKINSAYDEYRPFVKNFGNDFENDFMIFSSNRPGGKGGYDLYYAGIKKMTE